MVKKPKNWSGSGIEFISAKIPNAAEKIEIIKNTNNTFHLFKPESKSM